VLAGDFGFFQTAYGVTAGGNWEGKIVLQRAVDDAALAARFGISAAETAARLARCHAALLAARRGRVRPGTDDKVLVAWNALALTAFAEAARCLQRPDFLETARRNARFLLEHLFVDGALLRSWRGGAARHSAYLEDHAALALALLALYQSDPDPAWYRQALRLADEMVAHFRDPAGGFFDTRDDHEALLFRPRDLQDNATPSGSALAACALLQLAAYGDRLEYRALAEQSLAPLLDAAVRYPAAFARWLQAADLALGPTLEVALVGQGESARALVEVLWQAYRPRLVAAISPFPPGPEAPALLQSRPQLDGLPTAYVCQAAVCRQPVTSPSALAAELDADFRSAPGLAGRQSG
jgi:hypothetical protein